MAVSYGVVVWIVASKVWIRSASAVHRNAICGQWLSTNASAALREWRIRKLRILSIIIHLSWSLTDSAALARELRVIAILRRELLIGNVLAIDRPILRWKLGICAYLKRIYILRRRLRIIDVGRRKLRIANSLRIISIGKLLKLLIIWISWLIELVY